MKKLLILILMAGPAMADVQKNGKTVDCYCTDRNGDRVEMGQTICLQVDGRMFMAQCQMSLNNPMWRKVADGCLSSRLGSSALGQTGEPAVDAGGVDPQI